MKEQWLHMPQRTMATFCLISCYSYFGHPFIAKQACWPKHQDQDNSYKGKRILKLGRHIRAEECFCNSNDETTQYDTRHAVKATDNCPRKCFKQHRYHHFKIQK